VTNDSDCLVSMSTSAAGRQLRIGSNLGSANLNLSERSNVKTMNCPRSYSCGSGLIRITATELKFALVGIGLSQMLVCVNRCFDKVLACSICQGNRLAI
jgi:hypothetical protein